MSGLPEGWAQISLSEISLIEMGQSPSSETYNKEGVGLPFFQGKAEFRETYPEIKKWCSNPTKIAESGDILLSIRAPVGPTNLAPAQCCIGRGLAGIRCEQGLNQNYLFYFFKNIEPWLSVQGTGSTFAAISGQFIKEISVPLAPANEQTRIVAKLEELLSDLDAGVAELKAAQKKLGQYRQSLLRAAVEGKLTQHWREQHSARTPSPQPLSHQGRGALGVDVVAEAVAKYQPYQKANIATSTPTLSSPATQSAIHDNSPSTNPPSPLVGEGPGERGREAPATSETGAQLLERILKQRRAYWEAKQLAKFQAQGKTPPKGWQDKYPEPVKPDTSDLPELPEGWVWASAEQICDFITKGTTPTKGMDGDAEKKIPFLRVTNLTANGTLDMSDKVFVSENTHSGFLARSKVYPGDVLMNIVGPPLGQVSVVPSLFKEWNINQAIAIFRALEGVLPEFICVYLLSPFAQHWLQLRSKTTAGQTNLTLEVCRSLPIPLPPKSEQHELVKLTEAGVGSIYEQINAIQISLKQSTAQRQNILRAAFSGQLVPQDPNDEPASVLLERIRAERAAQQTAKAPKKRTNKTIS